MSQFALISPSMADMDDELNVEDARGWLQRRLAANDTAALARWATTYGLNLCDRAIFAAEEAVWDEDADDEVDGADELGDPVI